MKIVLGVVNEGDDISGLSMVTLFNNLTSLKKEMAEESISLHLTLRIVSSNPQSLFCRFAHLIFNDVEILSPRDWSLLKFPPQKNGSFSTYWKFDLVQSLKEDECLIYIDADAIILRRFHIGSIINQIMKLLLINSNLNKTGVLLMVPSHRPNLERMGYTGSANPYGYFNAGVFLALNPPPPTTEVLASTYNDFFYGNSELLFWHDQDLINALYSPIIHPIPFRYNVSSGMLMRQFYGITRLNYLAEREIMKPVVAHASGGILSTTSYYPWRDNFISAAQNLLQTFPVESQMEIAIKNFIRSTRISWGRKEYHKLSITLQRIYLAFRNRV